MNELLSTLREMPLWQAVALLLLQNLLVFALAVCAGHLIARAFRHRRVTPAPEPVTRLEIALTVSTILLNTLVTVAGFLLWRAGVVSFRTDVGLWALLDVVILLLVMDFAMYVLHRVAHHARLFPLLHRAHHRFNNPRPLTLFVLNPAETLSFGSLWLILISCYSFSWLGMSVYLFLNVVFGTIGHLGVEPLPDSWQRTRPLSYLSSSTFHAVHHNEISHNFGFYTLLWDKLFGTLHPRQGTAALRAGVASNESVGVVRK
ncbi:MAG: sterol desaturase family protein [Pyrinomonadaceae bacterium]